MINWASAEAGRRVSYRESPAPPALAHLVLSYWEFAVAGDAQSPLAHEVFADGCASLVHYRNVKGAASWLHIVGPRLDPFSVEVGAGDTFRGARLSPAACGLVLGRDPGTLRDQILPSSPQLPPAGDGLLRRLNRARGFAGAIAAYGRYLRSLGLKPTDVDRGVAAAVGLIEASQGRARIAEVAPAVGLSVRQLERRFRAAAGLTPKQFARLRRVRAAAVTLVKDAGSGWAQRAAEMGFADQPHLTREFVAVTGRPPAAFAGYVAGIEHGDLVE